MWASLFAAIKHHVVWRGQLELTAIRSNERNERTLVVIDHNLLAALVALELISLSAVAARLYLPSETREVVVSALAAFERVSVVVKGLLATSYLVQIFGTQRLLTFRGCLLLVWAVYANMYLLTLAVRPCALQGVPKGMWVCEVNGCYCSRSHVAISRGEAGAR